MELSFEYGKGGRSIHLSGTIGYDRLAGNLLAPMEDPEGAVKAALRDPIGTRRLRSS